MAILSRYGYRFDGVDYPPGSEIPAAVYAEHRPRFVDNAPDAPKANAPKANASPASPDSPGAEADAEPADLPGLSSMTKAELIAQAKAEGVDLSGASNNDERRDAIADHRSAESARAAA